MKPNPETWVTVAVDEFLERNQVILMLRDAKRPVTSKDILLLTGRTDVEAAGIINAGTKTPFMKSFFGFAECCGDCRKNKYHHALPKNLFDMIFHAYAGEVTGKGIVVKTASEAPATAVTVPASQIIEKIISIARLWTDKYQAKVLTFGRHRYTVLHGTAMGDEPSLIVYKKGHKADVYKPDDTVPADDVAPVVVYHKGVERKLALVDEKSQQIEEAYKVIFEVQDAQQAD